MIKVYQLIQCAVGSCTSSIKHFFPVLECIYWLLVVLRYKIYICISFHWHTDNMTVELKTRHVSSDFINHFQEKLVYVGDYSEYSEEFEQITKKWVQNVRNEKQSITTKWKVNNERLKLIFRSRKWRHMDLTGMRMTRWSLTVMSKMIYLHTLILDNCYLEYLATNYHSQFKVNFYDLVSKAWDFSDMFLLWQLYLSTKIIFKNTEMQLM